MKTFKSVRSGRLANQMVWLTLCLLFGSLRTFAADVVYIDRPNGQTNTRQQIETAATFYGLDMNTAVLESSREVSAALSSIRSPKTVAIVINADALSALPPQQVFALLHQREQGIPLLIAGINEHTSPALLKQWSSGAIAGCQRSALAPVAGWYEVANADDVTRQLSGERLPLSQRDVFFLTLGTASGAQRLMEARFAGAAMLVFARIAIDGQDVFFATEKPASDIPVTPDPYRQQDVFAAIAPPMMFLRYGGGERVWHTPGDYANLTIDDLWLREPYGHVNYEHLLQEAQQHDFHATIAFIPWNFDRSQPRMVSLFQAHPDRLSICVHGNNHVHQEFGPLDSHPLGKQTKDIQQSLARMEKFKQLTNIPYDAVMVFPHSISPEATFSALKGTNFLATANSLNVPSDANTPSDVEFALRTATLRFANFPSLRRYSAETDIPKSQLAIDAFLGNPMLFYAHESFFVSGIDAFNKTADEVNQIQPGMKWQGLGDIAKHLYLERLRDDGNFDVRALSGSIRLSNSHQHDASFFIEKDEDFAFPLIVLVDGQPYPFQKAGTQLHLQVPIAVGMSRLIEIKYENGLNLANIDISRNSTQIAAIRLLSDFRDNAVSNTALGRWFIHSYVDYGGRWHSAMAVLALFVVFFVVWYMRRNRKGVGANLPLPGGATNPDRMDLSADPQKY
jgi:peptidoglycan/xylan/chitin deacetylase (PgdA/CDA1 family)